MGAKAVGARAAPFDIILVVIVALVAGGFAVVMFADYRAQPELLWRGVYHDRNGHFSFGLNLALALRDVDLVAFFDQLEKARVWPPVHGLVLAVVMLVGGLDYRLGVVPSLIGWSVTVVCCWLIARDAFRDRVLGLSAGVIAVTFALASPSFRLLASDVMLEGLGAALSALAVWAYIAARRSSGSTLRWRVLAIVLTLLFFEKANYWVLVVGPLAVAAFSEEPRRWIDRARGAMRHVSAAALAGKVLRDPLLLAFAMLVGLIIYLYWRGPTAVVLFGRSLSLYPPQNLVTVAYWVLFIRALLAWWSHRAVLMPRLGVAGRELFYWHAVPLLVSFLLPKRLATLLWYIGPTHFQASQGGYDFAHAVQTYGPAFLEGFHVAPGAAIVAVVLFAVGVIQIRRLEPAVRSVFLVAVLSLAALLIHPQHQPRFMTTTLFALWTGAGIGAALLIERIASNQTVRPLIAATAAVALAIGSWLQPVAPRAHQAAIRPVAGPLDVDLVRPWLAAVDSNRAILVATTFGASALFEWVIHNDCQCRRRVLHPWIVNQPSRAAVRAAMLDRLAVTEVEFLVVIDAPGSRYRHDGMGWDYERMAGILDAMAAQGRFGRVAAYPLPAHGAEAVIWRRR